MSVLLFIKSTYSQISISFPRRNQMKLVECLELNTKEIIVEIV